MGTRPRNAALVSVSIIAILVGAIGAPVSAQSRSGSDQELLGRLSGRTRVSRNAETGHVGYLGGTSNRPVATSAALGNPATARGAARAFVGQYGKLFGVTNPARELDVAGVARPGRGRTFVRYQQAYRGIPVIAGELIVQTDRDRDIVSVGGEASPDLAVDTRASIGAGKARRLAVEATAKHEKVRVRTLSAGKAHLAIYDPRLTGDRTQMPVARLVWRVDVRSTRRDINEFVAIDADRGTTAAIFNQTAHADPPANAKQRVCNANNAFATNGEGTTDPLICDPGDPQLVPNPGASANVDVLGAFRGAEATYDFYARRFGRNSLNNSGMTLISTVRFCYPGGQAGCPLVNAFWDGVQMAYGDGYAIGDDVTGHELTHGVTEFSSGLLYFFQSGAINEALSDIMGEYVDQTTPSLGNDAPGVRWLIGEDIPIGAIRNMANPPVFGDPDRMGSPNYEEDPFFDDNGGVHSNSGVANKTAFLMTDGGNFNGQSITGLGIDRAAAIWYRTNNYLLSSGSDYNDLANALHQACRDLTGTTPRNGAGAPSAQGPVTLANCTEVDQAILATEMRNEPPVAKVKHTNLCAPGTTPTVAPFNDPINATAGGWVTNNAGLWSVISDYATSNPYAIFGINETVVSNTFVRSPRITVPSNAFLSFRHYLNLEAGSGTTLYDGGLVEYATNPSGPWTDLGSRFVFNGYNGTVSSGFGSPIGGHQAFGGFSNGWGQSKANLSTLAGKKVYLRFRIVTDNSGTAEGWAIDDVRVYRCVAPDNAGPTVTKPVLDLAKSTVELDDTPIPVKISFSATDPSGVDATFLERRLGAAPYLEVPLAGRRSTTVTATVPDSATVQQFKAGARDAVDNVGTNTKAAKIRAIQETGGAPAVVYTGAWSTEPNAGYFGGAVRFASAAGRRAKVTVTGATDLAWVTTKGPDRGKAEVWVDGHKKATIDLYFPNLKLRQVVYATSFASPGTHTIEVRVLGTKKAASTGKRVDLDAFEAIGN